MRGVTWTQSDPDSGRFLAQEASGNSHEFVARLDQLATREVFYVEVRESGTEYPLLTVGCDGSTAAVQRFVDGSIQVLESNEDDTAPPKAEFAILVMNELATFDIAFWCSRARALDILKAFVEGESLESVGTWQAL
jgi:hypothetical protein